VVEILHKLSRTGMTVIVIIHQPRAELWSLIDDVILLGRGGKLAYLGPRSQVERYVAEAGFPCASNVNLPDHLLDVLNGVHGAPRNNGSFPAAAAALVGTLPPGADLKLAQKAVTAFDDLAAAWSGGGGAWLARRLMARGMGRLVSAAALLSQPGGAVAAARLASGAVSRLPSLTERGGASLDFSNPMHRSTAPAPGAAVTSPAAVDADAVAGAVFRAQATALLSNRGGAPWWKQVALVAWRAAQQHSRGTTLLMDVLAQVLGGVMIGIGVSAGALFVMPPPPQMYVQSCPPENFLCNFLSRNQLSPSTFYISMTTAGLCIPAAVRTFHPERAVYYREASTGASKSAYFVGKVLAGIPYVAAMSLAFMAPLLIIAPYLSPAQHVFVSPPPLALTLVRLPCATLPLPYLST